MHTIYYDDALTALHTLPTGSVQCCVTSPPYWGLRDYGTATWSGGAPDCDHKPPAWINDPGDLLGAHPGQLDANAVKANRRNGHTCPRCDATRIDNQIGLEPTPAAYVARLVEVFAAVWRVLRDDGTLWLNLGDSYCSTDKWGGGKNGNHGKHTQTVDGEVPSWACRTRKPSTPGLKPKDLVGIPWRVAFALQDAGWYLRAEIIWAKKAPMPESVTDRPTRSHEQIFLFAKQRRYFYDAQAVQEASVSDHPSGNGYKRTERLTYADANGARGSDESWQPQPTRNQRDVWTLGPESFSGAHFATFPSEIPRRAILAGTSERGCCPACGAPWRRIVSKTRTFESGSGKAGNLPADKNGPNMQGGGETLDVRRGPVVHATTTGWTPTCTCPPADPLPCTVLDPFVGSGTTVAVALALGRDAIGIDLNPANAPLIAARIAQVQLLLPQGAHHDRTAHRGRVFQDQILLLA